MIRLLLALAAMFALVACGSEAPPASPAAAPLMPASQAVPTPTDITMDRLGIYSDLKPTGVDENGGFVIPDQADQASWFAPGPEPGQNGRSIILGHVNLSGEQGVFSRLREAREGDIVEIGQSGQVAEEWRVTRVINEEKADWTELGIYDELDHPEIVLITCGGALEQTAEGGRYLSNVLVFAERV